MLAKMKTKTISLRKMGNKPEIPMVKSKSNNPINIVKKENRKKLKEKRRQESFAKRYVELMYPALYTEIKESYTMFAKKYPSRCDLTKTYFFKKWEKSVIPKQSNIFVPHLPVLINQNQLKNPQLNKSPSPPQEVNNENPSPPQEVNNESPSPPQEVNNENPSPPQEVNNESPSPPQEVNNESPSPPQEVNNESPSPPQEVNNESPSPPQEVNNESPSPPQEVNNENPSPPQEVNNESPSPPQEVNNESPSPPQEVNNESPSPPQEVNNENPSPPQEVDIEVPQPRQDLNIQNQPQIDQPIMTLDEMAIAAEEIINALQSDRNFMDIVEGFDFPEATWNNDLIISDYVLETDADWNFS